MFVLQSSEPMIRNQQQPNVPFLVKLDVEEPHWVVGIDNLHSLLSCTFLVPNIRHGCCLSGQRDPDLHGVA